jgi:diketogulonate reductase-like aldo/keto reductase
VPCGADRRLSALRCTLLKAALPVNEERLLPPSGLAVFHPERYSDPRRYRRLGKTSLQASEIGFGDRLSIRALIRAFELGVNFIDTAYAYGNGHSERLIAEAFRQYGHQTSEVALLDPRRTELFVNERETSENVLDRIPKHLYGTPSIDGDRQDVDISVLRRAVPSG